MACHNCARKTLSLFIRSFTNVEPAFTPRRTAFGKSQQSRFLSACSPLQSSYREERRHKTKQRPDAFDVLESDGVEISQERPAWAAQKKAVREKLGGEAWNPRKKLSPDTMEGIRHLHSTQPDKFTTPVLAQHFKVSPEAIRRILKSKWRPTEEEAEARIERWDKRGERIWSNLVELGVKPPKAWRQMGVGRAKNGEKPRWKGRRRLLADVNDNAGDDFSFQDSDIIPIVDSSGRSTKDVNIPLTERI